MISLHPSPSTLHAPPFTIQVFAMRHFIDLLDWDGEQICKLLQAAERLKKEHQKSKNKQTLQGKVLGLIFEKPSLRTRVSFQAAIAQLGGNSIFLSSDAGLGTRETVPDYARTISQYVDAVVLRTFHHQMVLDFARYATCPIINGLSDYYHPCQALGDLLTMRELFGKLENRTVVFVGDGNNVARSLAIGCGKLGMRFILAAPPGYGFDQPFLEIFQHEIQGELLEEPDPRKAVVDADVVYTDVWTSMGQEKEAEDRRKIFAPFQVNADLMSLAPPHAYLMHCLPAHRGEEVTDDIMDSPRSVVFDQAGNRMHAQKALLQWLLGAAQSKPLKPRPPARRK
jgi:ornithine carbamoyltransferase